MMYLFCSIIAQYDIAPFISRDGVTVAIEIEVKAILVCLRI